MEKRIFYLLIFTFSISCNTSKEINNPQQSEFPFINTKISMENITQNVNGKHTISTWKDEIRIDDSNNKDTICFFFKKQNRNESLIYLKNKDKLYKYLFEKGFLYPDILGGSEVNPLYICCFEELSSYKTKNHLRIRFWVLSGLRINPTSYVLELILTKDMDCSTFDTFIENVTSIYLINEGLII